MHPFNLREDQGQGAILMAAINKPEWVIPVGILVAIILFVGVGVHAHQMAVKEQQDDMFLECVNAELHQCPDYSEEGKERCFQFGLQKCRFIYDGGDP